MNAYGQGQLSIVQGDTVSLSGAAPSHEERPWGAFTVIHRGGDYQVKVLAVDAGQQLSLQYHEHRDEYWVVARGSAVIIVGDEKRRIGVHDSAFVPRGTRHRITNPGPGLLEIVEVQYGDYLGEDDIVRLADRYGRA